jgi:predicted RNase H-like HicB family nuclease
MNNHKTLDYYMSLPYTIEFTPDIDGFWFAEIPMLEGCMTNGKNWQDALDIIQNAKQAWLMAAIELGMPIPEPEPTMS